MKTNRTIRNIFLALTLMLSVAACKKDKKDPDPVPPVELTPMTITELKALSTSASVKVPDSKKIKGIVISDASAKNVDSKTVILQEATDKPGIIISFDGAQTFAPNDEVEVNISNQTLAQVNNEVVLQNVPAGNAKKTGTGTITAKATNIADMITNKAAWDGTLVTLGEGSFSGGNGKYTGVLIYTDAKGTVNSNVLAAATFAGTSYPALATAVIGIVRVNGTDISVDIRNSADVTGSTTITRIITDDFSTKTADANGFLNTTPVGKWHALFDKITLVDMAPDASDDFLQPGKEYLYMRQYSGNQVNLGTDQNENPLFDYKTLKTISVTFAGSKFTGTYTDVIDRVFTSFPFDPAVNTISVALQITSTITKAPYTIAKFTYNDLGVFHTADFKLPEPTVEAYKAAIKAFDPATSDDIVDNTAKAIIDQFTHASQPDIHIIPGFTFNLIFSSSVRDPKKPKVSKEVNMYILQKVAFGFSK